MVRFSRIRIISRASDVSIQEKREVNDLINSGSRIEISVDRSISTFASKDNSHSCDVGHDCEVGSQFRQRCSSPPARSWPRVSQQHTSEILKARLMAWSSRRQHQPEPFSAPTPLPHSMIAVTTSPRCVLSPLQRHPQGPPPGAGQAGAQHGADGQGAAGFDLPMIAGVLGVTEHELQDAMETGDVDTAAKMLGTTAEGIRQRLNISIAELQAALTTHACTRLHEVTLAADSHSASRGSRRLILVGLRRRGARRLRFGILGRWSRVRVSS